MGTLTIGTTNNFIGKSFSPVVTVLDLTNPLVTSATATFAASQFNGSDISATAAVDGSLGINRLSVTMRLGNLDLSGLTLTKWTAATDRVILAVGDTANSITGTSQRDTVDGDGGGGRFGFDNVNDLQIDLNFVSGQSFTLGNGLSAAHFESIEILGSSKSDHVTGGDNADGLWGEDGDDVLSGGKGNDVLRGDSISPVGGVYSPGHDVLDGGRAMINWRVGAATR